jgi:PEGA domain-containing protein
MSAPSRPVRAPWGVATLALVSVLHTSVAAWAQAPAPPPGNTAAPTAPAAPGSNAAAEPSASARERARTAYGAGQEAYGAGQYAAAEAQFALADSLLPAVQAKFWRAMSLDKLGNVPVAIEAFAGVLASPDKDQLGAEKLATSEARHRALSAMPAELSVTTTPRGARVNVSGVDLTASTPLSLRLAPGRHILRVWLNGYEPQQIEIVATPGAKFNPTFKLVPQAVAQPGQAPISSLSPPPAFDLTPSTPAERSRVPGYVTLGIAGASAVVGTIFGIRALEDQDKFEAAPSTRNADNVERNALIADMAFGVTLTLGITGIVLLVADDPLPEQALHPTPARELAQLRVLPYVGPDGGGAAATLTF